MTIVHREPEDGGGEFIVHGGPVRQARSHALDRLRGLAIVLMVLDHALVVGAPHSLLRLTVTRLSLPLFMIVSGLLIRLGGQYRWLRTLELAAAAGMCAVILTLCWPTFGTPEILAVYLLVAVPCRRLIQRAPLAGAVLGYVQAWYWPLHWSGYQPGLVLLFLCVGSLCVRDVGELGQWGARCPAWLEPIGRRPLAWYVGHLCVLAAIAAVVR